MKTRHLYTIDGALRASTRRVSVVPRRYGKFDDFEKNVMSREAKKKQREEEERKEREEAARRAREAGDDVPEYESARSRRPDSRPSHDDVGGFFFDFGAIRDAPRRSGKFRKRSANRDSYNIRSAGP